jgi:hypothetical protein
VDLRAQIVEEQNGTSLCDQEFGDGDADETGAAGDQHSVVFHKGQACDFFVDTAVSIRLCRYCCVDTAWDPPGQGEGT